MPPDRIEAELPVRPELGNRNGNLHGGAVMAFADDLGGAATILNLPEGATTATIESKTNFFAAINVGDVARAECTALHRGRTTMVWQTKITRARRQTRRHRDPDPARDRGEIRQIAWIEHRLLLWQTSAISAEFCASSGFATTFGSPIIRH